MADLYSPVIFLAYANDRIAPERYLRNLVSEVRTIRRLLEHKVSPPYQVIVRGNATIQDIEEVFERNEGRVVLFHYAGHANDVQLMLESETGTGAPVGLEGFSRFLGNQKNLQLVFLNGCATRAHADALVNAGVPAVIATSDIISDRAAAIFSERFYQRLADRRTIRKSFEDAEIRTQGQLTTGRDYRSLYIPGEEKGEFPWLLLGDGINWRLSLRRSDAKGSVIPYLCDRDRQVEVFRDKLEILMADTSHPPHIFILHGSREERHRSLVRRLKDVDIRQSAEHVYGPETGLVYFYEARDWPYTGDLKMRQRNLQRSLAVSCELPGIIGSGWKAEDLITFQSRKGGIVVFQHTIFADKWDSVTQQLLRWYTREFWNVSQGPEISQFIIFINIVYPEESRSFWRRMFALTSARQDIRKDLYDLTMDDSRRMTLLRELKPIPYTDVVEWVEEYYPDELGALPDIIYGARRERPLPMDVIESQLIRETERINREKALRELYD